MGNCETQSQGPDLYVNTEGSRLPQEDIGFSNYEPSFGGSFYFALFIEKEKKIWGKDLLVFC